MIFGVSSEEFNRKIDFMLAENAAKERDEANDATARRLAHAPPEPVRLADEQKQSNTDWLSAYYRKQRAVSASTSLVARSGREVARASMSTLLKKGAGA